MTSRLITGLLVLMLLVGCAGPEAMRSPGDAPARSSGNSVRYGAILSAAPVAFARGGAGRPDTVGVNFYLHHIGGSRPIQMEDGEVVFALYDGILDRGADVLNIRPDFFWRFDSARLQPYGQDTQIGWVYNVPLSWGERRPQSTRVTVVAIFYPPDERSAPVVTAPTVVSINQ